MQTKVGIICVAFAPFWGSGTTILRELVYDTSSGSKVLTYALYYGYDEAGAISHVTVAEIVVAITDSNGTSEHKTACGMAAGSVGGALVAATGGIVAGAGSATVAGTAAITTQLQEQRGRI